MLASASGMSTTRSLPNRSISPVVVLKTPPSLPTSRPRTMTRGSTSISSYSALLIASTILRWVTSVLQPVEEVGLLPAHPRRQVAVGVREEILRARRGRRKCELERVIVLGAKLLEHCGLALRVPQAQRRQVLL